MALQLGGAKGSHWTEAGPEMDIGEQRAGSKQQTRRSLHRQKPQMKCQGINTPRRR